MGRKKEKFINTRFVRDGTHIRYIRSMQRGGGGSFMTSKVLQNWKS